MDDLKEGYPKTDGKKISGFKDVFTHVYVGITDTLLWDNAMKRLPDRIKEIRHILKEREKRL